VSSKTIFSKAYWKADYISRQCLGCHGSCGLWAYSDFTADLARNFFWTKG